MQVATWRRWGALAAVLSGAIVHLGCGSSSGSQPSAAADVTGDWSGTWQSSRYGVSGTFTASITQTGSVLRGSIDVPALGMLGSGLQGTAQGNAITFGDIDGLITFTGTVSGTSASGTYGYPSLTDDGSWGATRAAPVNSSGPAASLCQKYQDCQLLEPDQLSACQAAFTPVEMYIIDFAAVKACLSQASCAQIQDQAHVQLCLGYDRNSFDCNGTTLHLCNTDAKCIEIDCGAACRQFLPSTASASCAFDDQDQHDKCMCRL
jgi:hypothetical protein